MEGWLEKWGGKFKSLPALHLSLVFFLIVGLALMYFQQKGPAGVILEEVEASPPEQEQMLELERESAPSAVEEQDIFVHVSGEVICPGVVCLPYGSRVYEAVEMSGGMTEDGDLESVNLAQVLTDQQKIVVGSLEERTAAGSEMAQQPVNGANVSEEESQGKININTASKALLESLPGIGPVIADNIISYRQTKGSFQSIEEIKNVPRIGDVTFSNIRELIEVR